MVESWRILTFFARWMVEGAFCPVLALRVEEIPELSPPQLASWIRTELAAKAKSSGVRSCLGHEHNTLLKRLGWAGVVILTVSGGDQSRKSGLFPSNLPLKRVTLTEVYYVGQGRAHTLGTVMSHEGSEGQRANSFCPSGGIDFFPSPKEASYSIRARSASACLS